MLESDTPGPSTEITSHQEFWDGIKAITSCAIYSAARIEASLTEYVQFTCPYLLSYLRQDEDLTRCGYLLIQSNVFSCNKAYARRKLISRFIQSEGQYAILTILGAVLLLDARHNPATLEMMEEESAMSVLVNTIVTAQKHSFRLHRIFLELFYEMCQVQKLTSSDLALVKSDFIDYLFTCIENKVGYDYDPHSFSVIKVLLALNEQFMVAAYDRSRKASVVSNEGQMTKEENIKPHTASETPAETEGEPNLRRIKSDMNIQDSGSCQNGQASISLENRVFTTLALHKDQYRTFGEDIVFLLNRSPDNTLQLMVLKMLYLIFTTPATFEFLYLNDLKVIVDVFIRELYNLPSDVENLIHTYLRVLHPLLMNTELRKEGYKRQELVILLEDMSDNASSSYAVISDTTQRLAYRCLFVDWLSVPPAPTLGPRKSRTFDDAVTSSSSSEVPTLKSTPRARTFDDGPFSATAKESSSTIDVNDYNDSKTENELLSPEIGDSIVHELNPEIEGGKVAEESKDASTKNMHNIIPVPSTFNDNEDPEKLIVDQSLNTINDSTSSIHEQEDVSTINQSSHSSNSYDQSQDADDTMLTAMSPVSTLSSISDASFVTGEEAQTDNFKSAKPDIKLHSSEFPLPIVLNASNDSISVYSNSSSANSITDSLHEVVSSPTFSGEGLPPIPGQPVVLKPPPPPPPSRTKIPSKPHALSGHKHKAPPPPPPTSASVSSSSLVQPTVPSLPPDTDVSQLQPPPAPPPSIHRPVLSHAKSTDALRMLGTHSRRVCPPPPPPTHRLARTKSSDLLKSQGMTKGSNQGTYTTAFSTPSPLSQSFTKHSPRRELTPIEHQHSGTFNSDHSPSYSETTAGSMTPPPAVPPPRLANSRTPDSVRSTALATPSPPPPPPSRQAHGFLSNPMKNLGMSIRNTSALELAYATSSSREKKKSDIKKSALAEEFQPEEEADGLNGSDSWDSDANAQYEATNIEIKETDQEDGVYLSGSTTNSDGLTEADRRPATPMSDSSSTSLKSSIHNAGSKTKLRPPPPPAPPVSRLRHMGSSHNFRSESAPNEQPVDLIQPSLSNLKHPVPPLPPASRSTTHLSQYPREDSDPGFDFGLDKLSLPPPPPPPRTHTPPAPGNPRHYSTGVYNHTRGFYQERQQQIQQPQLHPPPPPPPSHHSHPHRSASPAQPTGAKGLPPVPPTYHHGQQHSVSQEQ